ncbi:MAG: DUF21 domain-containing protein [Actinomycetia bacterium]|nr:DUF21 domain-containing protein [Actinomycetes bacterium]
MSLIDPLLVAMLIVCFAGAAAFAVAEVSILRVRRSEVLLDADQLRPRARELLRLLDELPVVLNCVLLVVLLLQVSAATIASSLAVRWFGGVGVTIAAFVMTTVLFVYGEAVPKTMAMRSPHVMALRMTPLLRALVRVMRPPVTLLVALADLQTPGGSVSTRALTEREIRALAHEAAEVGEIEVDDVALVDRSFEFNDRCVADVMVERDRICSVTSSESVSDALHRAIPFGHRRLPVCGDDVDDIVGVVRLRDVASVVRTAPSAAVGSVATEALRCGPSQLISELLRRMQASGQWLALVADTDGLTVGLATIEDVVAELVGEISDETPSLGIESGEHQGEPPTEGP